MIKKIVLALVLILASSTDVVQANSISPTTIVNGLFAPTASQRFFREGRRQFQIEEQRFQNQSGFSTEDILQLPEDFDCNMLEQNCLQKSLLQFQKLTKFSGSRLQLLK